MPLTASSLSIAVQGIAEFLAQGLQGEDVLIRVDTPQRTQDRTRGAPEHYLNIFVYRILPSGFHADTRFDEPFFVRIGALLTPFPSESSSADDYADMRILGHAMRLLQSQPVLPAAATPLPGYADADPPPGFMDGQHLDYRLQAVLQAPSMEDLNHIWTTQGGELAYRLSAAYEFALIPIEPLTRHQAPPPPMRTGVLDLFPTTTPETEADGFIAYGPETIARPGAGATAGAAPPVPWLPVVLLVDAAGGLTNRLTILPGSGVVSLALAGPPGERVAVEVAWTRADESTDVQASAALVIGTHRIDDPAAAAQHALALTNPQDGDSAVIRTRPAAPDGTPLAGSPYANALTLTVVAGP